MKPSVAYLARGHLYVKRAGMAVEEVESAFAKQVLERQAKNQRIDGWKNRSGVWGSMGMAPPEWSQWENAGGDEARNPVSFRCVTPGDTQDQIYYILDCGDVSGVFRYDIPGKREARLMHRNEFPAEWLSRHDSGEMAVSLPKPDGTVGLAFSKNDGRHWNHVSGGDSRDQAPCWVREKRTVVFQSAPVGRNQTGIAVGQGAYTIEILELDGSGEVQTLHEQDGVDLLLPQVHGEQWYYIRRPYTPPGPAPVKPLEFLKDIVLFPYRLLRATFYFFNFLSVMFSGQPLATSAKENPWKDRQAEQRYLMMWGHLVDTRRQLTDSDRGKRGDLVPRDWELVTRTGADGNESVLAKHVLSYDVCDDGGVVYSNGSNIYYRNATGEEEVLCSDSMIQSVIAL